MVTEDFDRIDEDHEFFMSMLSDRTPIRRLDSWLIDEPEHKVFSIITEAKWQGMTETQRITWLNETKEEHSRRLYE